MKIKKLHITFITLLLWSFSYTQQYTNYNIKNGLPSNHVYRITQDVNGFIWFITDRGMVKYNGSEFKNFSIRDGLPTNDIWNIVARPDGKVWYFSKSPKIGYIKNDSIYAFPSIIKDEILYPLNRNIVGNNITFCNPLKYYKLENGVWKNNFEKIGGANHDYYKTDIDHSVIKSFDFSEESSKIIFTKNNNETIIIDTSIEIQESHTRGQVDNEYIWLSDKSIVVLNLDNLVYKIIHFDKAINIKKSKYVRMHLVNNQMQITGKGFVSVLDKDYNLVNTRYIPKYLKDHFSFIDKQDNLWVTTFTNGVYKLPKAKKNAVYSLINEKTGRIKKIDNKIIITVFGKGFYKYNDKNKQFEPYKKETDFTYGVYQINEINKKYFITNSSITTIQNNKKSVYKAPYKKSFMNDVARQLVYHKGYLYGNNSANLNKLSVENLEILRQYQFNGIRTFISFKNKLIVAASNGLNVFKQDQIVKLELKKKTSINNLLKKPILSLAKLNDDWLLVGTDSFGVYLTNLEKIIHLKETEFLSINSFYIKNENIWLATDKGVYHYKQESQNNFKLIAIYNENDGLPIKNVKSVYIRNDDLIISTNIGVVTIPKKKASAVKVLDLYFSKQLYNDSLLIKPVKYIENNTASFKISKIDFSENSNLSYDYQLLPIQKTWKTTRSNHIIFNDLPPNKYELHVKYKGKNRVASFQITPLWYQRSLMKLIFILLFLSIITAIILFIRRKEIEKQNKKMSAQKKLADFELHALRSQMNPHFVFNSLNAIQFYIANNESELSEKYLVKFSRLIRMFFDYSREREISLQNEIKLLRSYLEIEKMRFGKGLKFVFHVDKDIDVAKTDIPTMLLQPIVENSVNHGVFHNGGRGTINIFFTFISKNTFEVNIIDDGVGLEKAKEIQSKSIIKKDIKSGDRSTKVLLERLELLNQSNEWNVKYDIFTNIKNGTTVQLIFKKNE